MQYNIVEPIKTRNTMNALTIILLIYVVLDIISNLIIIALMKRKGISLADLAWGLKWLCKKEEPTEDKDYFYDEDEVDDQGYGY